MFKHDKINISSAIFSSGLYVLAKTMLHRLKAGITAFCMKQNGDQARNSRRGMRCN